MSKSCQLHCAFSSKNVGKKLEADQKNTRKKTRHFVKSILLETFLTNRNIFQFFVFSNYVLNSHWFKNIGSILRRILVFFNLKMLMGLTRWNICYYAHRNKSLKYSFSRFSYFLKITLKWVTENDKIHFLCFVYFLHDKYLMKKIHALYKSSLK